MIPEVELHTWRALRALTFLSIITTLLLVASTIAGSYDRTALAPTVTPVAPVALAAQVNAQPSNPAPAMSSAASAPAGVRVQTFAEIIPGDRQTAQAWADGADMQAESIARDDQLSAAARAAYPGHVVEIAESEIGAIIITATPIPAMPTEPVFYVLTNGANLRSGPGTNYPTAGTTGAGQKFNLVGRNGEWWAIDAGPTVAWIYGPLGRTEGDISAIPFRDAPYMPAPTPVPTEPPATPVPTPAPSFAYAIEQVRRHPEANTVAIYAYIADGSNAVGDLYLWVTHSGATYRSGPSSGLIAGMTKPSQPESPDNLAYNAKIDFPNFIYPTLASAGEWTVTLVDGNNQALSDTTTFFVAQGDDKREIYLRYAKR